jgi:hypothetical protein
MTTQTIWVRDDDASAFTEPSQIEQLYDAVWASGGSVTVSIVPAPLDDVECQYFGAERTRDPSIPDRIPATGSVHRLDPESSIAQALAAHAEAGRISPALHGLHHAPQEFGGMTNFDQVITTGMQILGAAGLAPTWFVPPYDYASVAAIDAITNQGLSISMGDDAFDSVADITAASQRADQPFAMACHGIRRGTFLVATGEEVLDPRLPLPLLVERLAAVIRSLEAGAYTSSGLLLVNHYWSFFRADGPARIRLWRDFVETVTTYDLARFCSLEGLLHGGTPR